MAVPVRKEGISDRRGSTESRPTEVVLRQLVDIDLGGALDNASLDHPCILKLSRIAFNHRMDRGIGRARLRRAAAVRTTPASQVIPGLTPERHGWYASKSQRISTSGRTVEFVCGQWWSKSIWGCDMKSHRQLFVMDTS